MSHPLGPLAHLILDAQSWQTQRGTYAGIWHPGAAATIDEALVQHTLPLDTILIRHLQRVGALPRVRVTRHLVALLPTKDIADSEPSEAANEDNPESAADDEPLPTGIPIWHHGTFEQASITPVAHAIHLLRYLDDYHELTLAAQRRRALRALPDTADDAARQVTLHAVAQAFLESPVRWRDVVTTATYLQAVGEVERALHRRLKLPGRTLEQLQEKLAVGLDDLVLTDAEPVARQIRHDLAARQAQLDQALVTLVYQEQQYLQLLGIQHGRAVRRHLARGLHLVISDQQHRRRNRIVDAWQESSRPDQFIVPMYYVAPTVPPAYAARKVRPSLRLRDANDVAAYLTQYARVTDDE